MFMTFNMTVLAGLAFKHQWPLPLRHCNALQRTATHCNAPQHTATYDMSISTARCNTLQHTAVHCNTCNTLQITAKHTAYTSPLPTATDCGGYFQGRRALDACVEGTGPWLHCNTLQHTATHCNTLQHTATHCNTLQHAATLTPCRSPVISRVPSLLCACLHEGACYTLQHTASHCITLQHTAHTATHCNTLQHTASHFHGYFRGRHALDVRFCARMHA